MNKKVGIVSCYFKHNYGSMLQAYATQEVLNNMGIENETINIDKNKDFSKGKKKYYATQILNFPFIKEKLGMVKLKIDKKIKRDLGKNISIRDKYYNEFQNRFNLTKPYKTYADLTEKCREYSNVIVGSDQLWLPVNVVADYYTLNWVPNKVNKISLATSFGISEIPSKYKRKYNKFLSRIENISVREDDGIKLVKELSGKDAKLVCDPTLLLTKDEWMKIQQEKPVIDGKYILCYFLGKNIQHRKFAERLKEKTGYKIVSLNHADEYVKYSDKFADETPYNVGPSEWINLIRNAEYVCTDSFHGTVFSILYNKEFFNFRRYDSSSIISTNSRLDSLLTIAGISNKRILLGNEDIEEVLKLSINYDYVNKNIEKFRRKSKKFLEDSLIDTNQEKKTENAYIEIHDKSRCCGCTACKSICPKDAIEMLEDEEGFLYPKVEKEKCINCGACKRVCPIINEKEETFEQDAYLVNNKNEDIRRESTSGGAFSAIAEYALDRDGVVFGAAFNKDYEVIHTYVENKDEIYKFRGSKYVQSHLGNTFSKVKNFLDRGRVVCFSGTPCQVEGLKSYLTKEYNNLITVDVMCHAVPSPLVWKKYLNYEKSKLEGNSIQNVLFRDKSKYGYKYSTMTIRTDKDEYSMGVETDPFLRAFFGDLSDRPSCYDCRFKKQHHESDFTIWDCFIVDNFDKSLDDDKGTSRILVNTDKGRKIFESIKSNFQYTEVETDTIVRNVREMLNSVGMNKSRGEFFEELNEMEEKEFFEKWFPNSFKVKIERFIRITMAKTGIYKTAKKVAKKIRGSEEL